jgi:hypothetical protein
MIGSTWVAKETWGRFSFLGSCRHPDPQNKRRQKTAMQRQIFMKNGMGGKGRKKDFKTALNVFVRMLSVRR